MPENISITDFLSLYEESVQANGELLREILLEKLPGVTEQLDLPAKMIAYCYGQRYIDMICAMFPSKKGLKLSFYDGVHLPDPHHLLEGNAKTSRYVQIRSADQINSESLSDLIRDAMKAFRKRMNNINLLVIASIFINY